MMAPDKRLTAARYDLAASSLKGLIESPRYVEGDRMIVFNGFADVRREAVPDAPLDTQALHGEVVTVFDQDEDGWSWVQLERDSYVGYMPSAALSQDIARPTHRVHVLRSFLYGGPSIKLPPIAALSLNSQVTIVGTRERFAVTHRGHFIFADHLVPVEIYEPDFVSVAEKFLNLPYFWGGKTSFGLDCSGLVQNALEAAGQFAPRDTDMQEQALGTSLAVLDDLSGLKRGDLIFWKGHVGIMRDAHEMLHASGHQMLVVSEPLHVARDRILANSAGPITSIKRL